MLLTCLHPRSLIDPKQLLSTITLQLASYIQRSYPPRISSAFAMSQPPTFAPPPAGPVKPDNKDSDDEDEVEQLQYKVVILGDGAVGKTSLTSRFCEDHFAAQYKQTIGVDWFIKRVVLPGSSQRELRASSELESAHGILIMIAHLIVVLSLQVMYMSLFRFGISAVKLSAARWCRIISTEHRQCCWCMISPTIRCVHAIAQVADEV